MRKRTVCTFFSILLACMMLGGCKKNVGTPEDNPVAEEESEEEEEKVYVFGYSCIDMDNPYFDTLRRSLENTLGEEEYTLISKNPGADIKVQNRQIEELVEEGIDALFLCPVDWEAITPSLEMLRDEGIPVINIDTQVKEGDLIRAYVGSDNRNAGFVCGEDLKKKCPKGGKLLILECPSMSSVNDRITGFEQAIADGGFEVLDRADVNGEMEKAREAMEGFLDKYQEIDAVMCGNDRIALGALRAVEASDSSVKENIRIYGVDGSPEIKSEIAKTDSPMTGTGAQSPIRIGKEAAEIGIAILNGENFEAATYEDTFLIDKGNVEMYGTDGWQ